MTYYENNGSGIEERNYDLHYEKALDYWNKHSIGVEFNDYQRAAFCQIYAEIGYLTQGFRWHFNRRYTNSLTSNAELKNWLYAHRYLLDNYEDGRPSLTQENLNDILEDLYKKVINQDPNVEIDPDYEIPDKDKDNVIDNLKKEDLPKPIKKMDDDFCFTGGAAPIQSDPLLIDLNGDGIKTTNTKMGNYFDHENDGFAELSAWVDSNDGILVYDRNKNGKIDNGTELILYDNLSEYDSNLDGVIDSKDESYSNLKILKGDGSLLTLQEAGITSISSILKDVQNTDENGNKQFKSGTYTKIDGSRNEFGGFELKTEPCNSYQSDLSDIDEEIEALPYIANYGTLSDLHQAMQKDETGTLKALIVCRLGFNPTETRREMKNVA